MHDESEKEGYFHFEMAPLTQLSLSLLSSQSQYLIVPSHEQVATHDGSNGCHNAEMHT